MQTTSITLIERLRLPNQPEAWNRFVQLYTPLLLTWAQGLGLREADAADLAQDVLIKLLRQLPTYRREAGRTFRGWLFTVARNECADFRRRRATRPLPGSAGLSDVPDSTSSGELSEADYRAHLVHRALELIHRDFEGATWDAFTRVMLEGRAAPAVAAELGVPVNRVYLARHRVLTRLRDELHGLFE